MRRRTDDLVEEYEKRGGLIYDIGPRLGAGRFPNKHSRHPAERVAQASHPSRILSWRMALAARLRR